MFKKNTNKPFCETIGEIEEYETVLYHPLKIQPTADLIRRQHEEEIRKKYCNPKTKYGEMD